MDNLPTLVMLWVGVLRISKLRTVIENHKLNLGTTKTGRDWCLKALHPADALTDVEGVPDQSAVPTVMVNYQAITTIGPHAAATGTWFGGLWLIPHPICPLYYFENDSASAATVEFLNPQIAGPDHSSKFNTLIQTALRWRLAYMSATLVQDGADLSNQGTIVACQTPVEGYKLNYCFSALGGTGFAQAHCVSFDGSEFPDYEQSQSAPNAYFNKSKEGAYMCLKLTPDHQRWRSHSDCIMMNNHQAIPVNGVCQIDDGSTANIPPFLGLKAINSKADQPDQMHGGQATSDFCNSNWGFISWRNVAVTSSMRVFIRMGFEMQVSPGTQLTPFQKLSPPYDPMAIADYYTIARELKDAYPEDYNSAGKIWDSISSIAKMAAPFLGAIPEVGPALSAVVGGAAGVGDFIKSVVDQAADDSGGPSLGQKETAKAVVNAASAPKVSAAFRGGSGGGAMPPQNYGGGSDSAARVIQALVRRHQAENKKKKREQELMNLVAPGLKAALGRTKIRAAERKLEQKALDAVRGPLLAKLKAVRAKKAPPTVKINVVRPGAK